MGKDIKIKTTTKDVKILDKSAVAVERMKQAYIRTKDRADHSLYAEENSPNEYASDRVSGSADSAAHEAVYQFDKQGRKGVKTTRENVSKAKETLQKRRYAASQAQKETAHQAADTTTAGVQKPAQVSQNLQKRSAAPGSAPSNLQKRRAIKTLERSRKEIKTVDQSRKTIKQAASGVKGTVKTTQKSVKTAQATAKTSIKTSQQAAKAAQRTAQATAKAAKAAVQAARTAARTAAAAAKAAVKATLAAVKAIILATKALIAALAAGGWIAVLVILIIVLFGCALSLFGGGSESNAYTPVSAEVQAYEPLIQKYTKEHGIPEYVELVKAVMMQESGGRGSDPMQASECGYNTRYPNTPGGITDPEYSIDVGIQNLAACLKQAETESPIDMERIKLALQGYNFGNGYISWAKETYGGYSYANAVEFSQTMAERLGWESYGDTQYVSHVLRYYPFGRAFTSGGNQAIVEVALTQVGNEGGQPYWSWYGFSSREEWCACFVSWCAEQCNYIEGGFIPKFSYCPTGADWFKDRGQWQDRSYEPSAGDLIFFDWDSDGTTDHVGLVERVENGRVYTVEGNSGDMVRQSSYPIGYANIYGYGVPSY